MIITIIIIIVIRMRCCRPRLFQMSLRSFHKNTNRNAYMWRTPLCNFGGKCSIDVIILSSARHRHSPVLYCARRRFQTVTRFSFRPYYSIWLSLSRCIIYEYYIILLCVPVSGFGSVFGCFSTERFQYIMI